MGVDEMGRWPIQERVHEAEHRRIRSYPERERQHDEQGQTRLLQGAAAGIAQVLHEDLEKWNPGALAIGVLHGLERSELRHGGTPRFSGRHSGPHVVVDMKL